MTGTFEVEGSDISRSEEHEERLRNVAQYRAARGDASSAMAELERQNDADEALIHRAA